MEDNNIIGVSEEGIDALATEINDAIDSIDLCFKNINLLFDGLNDILDGQLYSTIKSKANEIISTFPVIQKNLSNYKEDFITVKNNSIQTDKSISKHIIEINKYEGGE